MECEEAMVPEEYANDGKVKSALAESGIVSDPSKVARELLGKAYGDGPYHVW